eukprot:810502-Pelagomonas_calceolata.AAC.2
MIQITASRVKGNGEAHGVARGWPTVQGYTVANTSSLGNKSLKKLVSGLSSNSTRAKKTTVRQRDKGHEGPHKLLHMVRQTDCTVCAIPLYMDQVTPVWPSLAC